MNQSRPLVMCMLWHLRYCLPTMLIILMIIPMSPLQAQDLENQTEDQITPIEYRGQKAAAVFPGANYVKQNPETNYPLFVKLNETERVSLDNFFPFLQTTLKTSTNLNFRLLKSYQDDLGMTHNRYLQTLNGIPIEGMMYIVHVKDGQVASFNGNAISSTEKTATSPQLQEADALKRALTEVGAKTYKWEIPWEEELLKKKEKDINATYFPKGELTYVLDINILRLAWQFDIFEKDYLGDQRIYIDAISGEKIKSYPLTYPCDGGTAATTWHGTQNISTDLDGSDYILVDDCTGSHDATIHTFNDLTGNDYTDADNSWTEASVSGFATSHYYAHETMLYYDIIHGWNSYDDAGSDFDIRHRDTFSNAFYSNAGGVMVFGNGNTFGDDPTRFYNTLDVVGHEFTHGVVDFTADLVYQGEPGALNESFADILGEAVERWSENNQNIDWLHREDYVNGENRSFIDPKDKGDPDTYNGTNWASTCNTCGDSGGVHTNSGVQNHWFYLVSEGGSGTNDNGDDYEVIGVGFTAARSIAWRNLSVYLGVNSDYSDARTGAISAAEDLYGICSAEVKAVMDAWYAVGVGDPFLSVDAAVTSNYNGSDISCFGASDGEATATGSDGNPPYTYLWSDGQNTMVANGLSSGSYSVEITDADGCTADSESVMLEDPPLLTVSISVVSDYNGWPISCAGACDGIVQANPSGGTGSYGYKWGPFSDGQDTQQASDLCAGTHRVTVTDANNCSATAEVTIAEPPPLEIDAGQNQTVFFYDLDLACTTLMASGEAGGVPPYTYSWSSGGNAATEDVCLDVVVDTVTTVTYTITLTDANGCTVMDDVDVCYVDIRCTKGNGQTKVRICHFPGGNPANSNTNCISLSALDTHLAHGDHVASCGFVSPCDSESLLKFAFGDIPKAEDNLLEAFPNPFSEKTTIRFVLHEDTEVDISVHNIHGQLLDVVYEGSAKADIVNDFDLKRNDLAPGVYIVRMQTASGDILNRKIVVGGD